MLVTRRLSAWAPAVRARVLSSGFHSSPKFNVSVGDSVPDVELMEGSPGNKVNLSKALGSSKGLVIGVPAAFSPGCSESHIPGYIKHAKLKGAGDIFVVSVNDAFVMKAWAKSLDPRGQSNIRFLADPSLAFTGALDLAFDGSKIFGGDRGKRYALCIRDGKVVRAFVEPDNTGIKVSAADEVLKEEW